MFLKQSNFLLNKNIKHWLTLYFLFAFIVHFQHSPCCQLVIPIAIFYAELVEHTCGLANLHMGDFFSNISNGIDTYSIREPLGVCAGICSFNFPAMIPLLVCFCFSIPLSLANQFFSILCKLLGLLTVTCHDEFVWDNMRINIFYFP